ncbi:MAG: thiamine-phosphate kinase [Propionibacteriaceae bacterium]|jgi:thiamine-monophosphate kinase|nr:thiamine-phosphate kinase [Propionibacteriaceae bacterium]
MSETLADVGEFPLIQRVLADLPQGSAVSLGPGDDGGVFLVDGRAVTSVDVFVEGVHFKRDWASAYDIGRKAVAASAADLEAMGAYPVAVLVGFAAPPDLPAEWASDCVRGIRAEAGKAGLSLVGGDVSSARDITLAVTVIGETRVGLPVLRSGARPGDLVALRGRLGWAAAGLAALRRGFRSPRVAVQAFQCPTPPYGAGAEAAGFGASAMIDVSDGLLADLGHVARASGVLIDLDTRRLEIGDAVQAVAQATGREPLEFVLTGGEDHALVATFPYGQVPQSWTVIGRVEELGGLTPTVLVDGDRWAGPTGWTHFA